MTKKIYLWKIWIENSDFNGDMAFGYVSLYGICSHQSPNIARRLPGDAWLSLRFSSSIFSSSILAWGPQATRRKRARRAAIANRRDNWALKLN